MNALECLSDLTLRAYQEGSVDPAQLDSVAEHVSTCPSCLGRLQELDSSADPLLRALRRQQPSPIAAEDPLLAAAVLQVLSDGEKPRPVPRVDVRIGSMLNEYRLLERLGSGGMGAVYRALHVRLDKEVALKVIQPLRGHDARLRERFQREMKAIGRLRHPHIVLATDAGQAKDVLYLVMELEQGEDLASYVRRQGPMPVVEACEYARQAALGLQGAHEAGLVHRDVKPSNLFRTSSGQVKLLDLGLALLEQDAPVDDDKDGDSMPVRAHTMGPMGTDDYMAPEQWRSAHHVDARADLYSLGCTLFFLLTGQPPFQSPAITTRAQLRQAHLREPAPALQSLRQEISPQLADLVRRLLAKEPAERFSSAKEVAQRLAALTDSPSRGAAKIALAGLFLMGALCTIIPFAGSGQDANKVSTNDAVPAAGAAAEPAPEPLGPPPASGALPMTPEEARQLQQDWAGHLKLPVVQANSLKMEFALIPPGEFKDKEFALVADSIRLKLVERSLAITRPFYLATTEVTLTQFRRFVTEEGYQTDAESGGKGGVVINFNNSGKNRVGPLITWFYSGVAVESQDCPVTQVSWNDAVAFCAWLSRIDGSTYRLPTAAEWKWAARAGLEGANVPLDRSQLAESVWFRDNSDNHPHAVGGLKPNAWGLYDMWGNVAEWSFDYPEDHRVARTLDPPQLAIDDFRATLGGDYIGRVPNFRFSTTQLPSTHASSTIGFRLVREIPATTDP